MKKANDYNPWYRKNGPQNARKDFQEYNRPFTERYNREPEYYKRPDAYQHYPERYDYAKDQDSIKKEEKERQGQQRNNNAASKGKAAGKSIVKTVAGNAVAAVVGAIVLVSGYQAMEAKSVQTLNSNWMWSEDYQSCILKLESTDKSIRKQINIVTNITEEVLPTCVNDGYRVYTASADYRNVTYTDTRNVVLDAHGHHFDEGVIVDGHIEYTCSDCGETVAVEIEIEEDD